MIFRSQLIAVGEPAPDFTCALSDGHVFRLSGVHMRQRVVLVFYPGNNTPICTAQLCAFRDDWSRFQQHDTVVFGVNPASQSKLARFAKHNQFPFPLLVDRQGQIAAAYGCRALFGIVRRCVYLIDKQGHIAFAERGKPAPQTLLQTLQTLRDGSA